MSAAQNPIDGGTIAVAPYAKIDNSGNSEYQFIFGFVDLPQAEGVKVTYDTTKKISGIETAIYKFDYPNEPVDGAKTISYLLPVQFYGANDSLPTVIQIENSADSSKKISRKVVTSKPNSLIPPMNKNTTEGLNIPRCHVVANESMQPGGQAITYYFILILAKTNGDFEKELSRELNIDANELIGKCKTAGTSYGGNIASYCIATTDIAEDFTKATVQNGDEYNSVNIDYTEVWQFEKKEP